VRVVIAEDGLIVREGIAGMLRHFGHEVAAAVGDAPALLAAVAAHRPDVVVTDVRMPPGYSDEGLQAAIALRAADPDLPVLVLSQYVEQTYAAELLDSGRSAGVGYLLKDRIGDVAEFVDASTIDREGPVAELGPDVLSESFDAAEALARLQARGDMEIADALLDQRALAGIGNVFKSEVLFAARVNPFTKVGTLDEATLARIVTIAQRQMRANAGEADTMAAAGGRRTTNRLDPSARLWVYGRRGLPCRRCGAAIQRAKQGPDTRSTYWCERCQPRT